MADVVELSIDAARLGRDGDRITRRYLLAGTRAVRVTTKQLERDLEAATKAGVPGRLWRAWASETFPRGDKPARDPAGDVFVNGSARSQGAISFWTKPGEVRGKGGQYLAIPLPAAGPRGRKRDLSPGEWERAHGIRLRFVYRTGRASLLVADQAVLSGRSKVARRNTDRRIAAGRGSATVPIFVLLPMLKFRNSVAIEPLIAAARARLPANLFAEIERMNGGDR